MSLVLRIRRETLRENLRRAHEALKNLSSVHERLVGLKQQLKTAGEEMERHRKTIEKVLADPREDTSALEPIPGWMHNLRMQFIMQKELKSIEDRSFIAKVKTSAVIEWQNRLRGLALDQLNKIRDEATTTWSNLNLIEDDAKEMVFAASVELLGGIALRDVRLNAEVCELAEELLWVIRSNPAPRWAMLGGLTSILTRLDDVVRLPYPQWSVWHLPFAVHELWQVEERIFADIKRRLRVSNPAALGRPDIDQRLADACTTYVLGPAFAYAAVTLSFDPADPRFDNRVEAIRAMLAHMTGGEDGGDSYKRKVAEMIGAEWQTANNAARRGTPAPRLEPKERILRQLRDAVSQELGAHEAREAFDAAWDRAVAKLIVPQPVAPAEGDDFQPLCAPLAEALQVLGFRSFPQSMWHEVKKNWMSVLDPDGRESDLRKVLNAAWEARIDPGVTARDLSKLAAMRADISEEERKAWSDLTEHEKKAQLLADLVRRHVRAPLDKVAGRSTNRQPVGDVP